MSEHGPRPNLAFERRLWAQGFCSVAGLDEAGRGAWAGPVVAAAVILPSDDPDLVHRLDGVRDSKTLGAARREQLLSVIQRSARAWAACAVPPEQIDTLGIVPATRQAMALALQSLTAPADHLLIDYVSLSAVSLPQISLPKGDAKVLSIAGRPAYLYPSSGWIYDGSPRCINHLFKINLSEGASPVPVRGREAE